MAAEHTQPPLTPDASIPVHAASAGLAGLSPAYFGLVMATGIVSVASQFHGLHGFALALFALNITAWLVLCVLNLARAIRHPRHFFGDMVDHLRAPGFFTAVAGTSVLGGQALLFVEGYRTALALGAFAALLWVVITYTVLTALTVKSVKPPLDKGISGGWLLAVVSTQSLALLAALLAGHIHPPHKIAMNFFALSMWLWGGMLYIWLMSLIFYRYTFFRLAPEDLTPPYWINMGAMAISTLAGSMLILNAPDAPFMLAILPFVKGFTVLYWATATWWIPMLLLLGVWRYGYMRFPLRYDPLYWGAVFPLGMYSAATYEMAESLKLDFLWFPARIFLYTAIVAWAAAFFGLLRRLARLLTRRGRADPVSG
ncbi:MAG: tellurite resistance/C4-dicarboxylate transporter family protein [Burkholderiales bacterium]|nr:tellurite resistance/C4-dicarboxylate transporter family protein [Burkholderiales bacterium]